MISRSDYINKKESLGEIPFHNHLLEIGDISISMRFRWANNRIWRNEVTKRLHCYTFFLYKQLHFPSQPGVANEIWENEAENCLAVA